MTYEIKLVCILVLVVAVSHGATDDNQVVAHVPGTSSTSNVGHYSTNSYNGGSGSVSGAKDEYHSSCTCESSAGSNNGSPASGTSEGGSSRWGHWGSGGGSSGNYGGAYGNWRGYGSFSGSTGGGSGSGSGSGGGYNP